MTLGENIYRYRIDRGLSQGGLADALEVSRQSVSKWENNSAVPELDKLIRMSKLFHISLDELVYGEKEKPTPEPRMVPSVLPNLSPRQTIGYLTLLFGMVFFLLSIFWGDRLYLGEEFGELLSISIVLVSIALVATYNQVILAICAICYFIYGLVSSCILQMTSMTNYIFLFFTGIVILVWFVILGLKANSDAETTTS